MELTFTNGLALSPSKDPYFLGDAGIDGYISIAASKGIDFDRLKVTLEEPGVLLNTIRSADWYVDTLVHGIQRLLQLDDIKTTRDFVGLEDQAKSTPKCFFHFDIPKTLQSELLGQNRGFLRDLPPSLPSFESVKKHPVLQPRYQGESNVGYNLRVQALVRDKVVASITRTVNIIPTLDVPPPFCVADFPGEYVLTESRCQRIWRPGGSRTRELRIEASQPLPVILCKPTDDTVFSTTLSLMQINNLTRNCRELPRAPVIGQCVASLVFSTYISSDPRESAPTLEDVSSSRGTLCRNEGVYAKVEVPVQFSGWKEIPHTLPQDDGTPDTNTDTAQRSIAEAQAHLTLNFGQLKYPVPSFESSLVSRRYKLDLCVRVTASNRRRTFRLILPAQISYSADKAQSPRTNLECDCPPYFA
ncbi:hypothetical protein AYO21_04601 [Fonsecaea monophora]|uniref:Arrestin-like N-terminal domain-containing protein n=1 Tax=Fonsecaea monophora TaxID=254056 RepID=A0A177FC16_9EURO|nr:hypothetical protein AYO21_04601 [Fonsecaea monophora]OAG41221.1 hypothetical protein AYO21_04601 [Fonsecaea monophora]